MKNLSRIPGIEKGEAMAVLYRTSPGKLFQVFILIVMLLIMIGLLSHDALGGADMSDRSIAVADQNNLNRNKLNKEYEQKIEAIRNEIKKTGQDMEWLSQKIKQMEAFHTHIPQKMHDSIALKKAKIAALEKNQKSLENLLGTWPVPGKPVSIEQVEHGLEKAGLSDWMEFIGRGTATTIGLVNSLPILFASGSADIPEEYQVFLKTLADFIKAYDVRVIVDGYADTDPIHTGQYPSNFSLGSARALSVVHLFEKHGVHPSVFQVGTTGEYRFRAGKPSQMKAVERHVKITILFRS